MGDFETLAPTIAAAGILEADVVAEIDVPDAVAAPVEPTLRPVDVRQICKFASVYGRDPNTISNLTKREYAGMSVETFALSRGLWPEQVRRVMGEWKAFVAMQTGGG